VHLVAGDKTEIPQQPVASCRDQGLHSDRFYCNMKCGQSKTERVLASIIPSYLRYATFS